MAPGSCDPRQCGGAWRSRTAVIINSGDSTSTKAIVGAPAAHGDIHLATTNGPDQQRHPTLRPAPAAAAPAGDGHGGTAKAYYRADVNPHRRATRLLCHCRKG